MAKKKKKDEVVKTPIETLVDTLAEQLETSLDKFECAKMGFEKRLQIIISDEKFDVGKINDGEKESGNSALILASKHGKLKCVQLLVEKGADVNATGYYGLTAIHHACRNDNTEVITYLMEKGAKTDIEDNAGNTAMHDAARMGNLKCVEILVAAGENQEHCNAAGATSFMGATMNARGALIDIMLRNGVNVNAVDAKGDSPLHISASCGLDRIVSQLVASKARTDIVNLDGKTAADVARSDAVAKKLTAA